MHYLDNAATTPVLPEVADIVHQTLLQDFGNPSSLHSLGEKAHAIVEDSRKTIADALGCSPEGFYFTGSGTESNNIALLGVLKQYRGGHIIATGYEHPSVTNVLLSLMATGAFAVDFIRPVNGVIPIEDMVSAIRANTLLVTAMHVNNETGALIDVEKLCREVKKAKPSIHVHVDGVQAFGKVPIHLGTSFGIDTYSISGHKIGAPKGIGGLYVSDNCYLDSVLFGGGQERGLRPGTENVAYIRGFAKAVELLPSNRYETFLLLDWAVIEGLKSLEERGIVSVIHAGRNARHIHCFSILGIPSETTIKFLSDRKIYVSGGSACSKGMPSHTLSAMGLSDEIINSAIRVSLSYQNTIEDVEALFEGIEELLKLEGIKI